MKVSLRKKSEESVDVVEVAEQAESVARGKGRATPKRRDSVVQRGPVTAPKTRKEAYARQKQQSKAAKVARRTPASQMTVADRRAALRSGEMLPKRDQGATRKLARDYVDSHRLVSNYLLVLFPLMIVSYVVKTAWINLLVLVIFFGILVEWFLIGRRIRRLATERNGSAEGSPMSIGFYAGSRAYLPRRWRLPAPQKSLGDAL
ncbi:MAG: DUF3043 domain-containing protein [Jatrophihabitantaceae bacterium]